jgi:hypothetical protein
MESPPGQVGFSRGENSFQAYARMALKLFILSAESIGAAFGKSRGETVENMALQAIVYQELTKKPERLNSSKGRISVEVSRINRFAA